MLAGVAKVVAEVAGAVGERAVGEGVGGESGDAEDYDCVCTLGGGA